MPGQQNSKKKYATRKGETKHVRKEAALSSQSEDDIPLIYLSTKRTHPENRFDCPKTVASSVDNHILKQHNEDKEQTGECISNKCGLSKDIQKASSVHTVNLTFDMMTERTEHSKTCRNLTDDPNAHTSTTRVDSEDTTTGITETEKQLTNEMNIGNIQSSSLAQEYSSILEVVTKISSNSEHLAEDVTASGQVTVNVIGSVQVTENSRLSGPTNEDSPATGQVTENKTASGQFTNNSLDPGQVTKIIKASGQVTDNSPDTRQATMSGTVSEQVTENSLGPGQATMSSRASEIVTEHSPDPAQVTWINRASEKVTENFSSPGQVNWINRASGQVTETLSCPGQFTVINRASGQITDNSPDTRQANVSSKVSKQITENSPGPGQVIMSSRASEMVTENSTGPAQVPAINRSSGQVTETSPGLGQVADINRASEQVTEISTGPRQVTRINRASGQATEKSTGTGQATVSSRASEQVTENSPGQGQVTVSRPSDQVTESSPCPEQVTEISRTSGQVTENIPGLRQVIEMNRVTDNSPGTRLATVSSTVSEQVTDNFHVSRQVTNTSSASGQVTEDSTDSRHIFEINAGPIKVTKYTTTVEQDPEMENTKTQITQSKDTLEASPRQIVVQQALKKETTVVVEIVDTTTETGGVVIGAVDCEYTEQWENNPELRRAIAEPWDPGSLSVSHTVEIPAILIDKAKSPSSSMDNSLCTICSEMIESISDDDMDLLPLSEYAKQLLNTSINDGHNMNDSSSQGESIHNPVELKTGVVVSPRPQCSTLTRKRKAKERALQELQDLDLSGYSSGSEYSISPKRYHFQSDSSDTELDTNANMMSIPPNHEAPGAPVLEPESVQDGKAERARTRMRNPEAWKSAVRKRRRNEGKEYSNSKGKRVPMKTSTTAPCKCKYKCHSISEDDRISVFNSYWKLGYERQRDFIKQNVKQIKKRRHTKKNRDFDSRRQHSVEYYLPIRDGKLQVCKKTFLAVLNIGERTVYYTLSKRTSLHSNDQRGRSVPVNKIPELEREYIRDHIRSFPKVPSHYCRSSSRREYLSSDLSVNKMYSLYAQKCTSENRTPLKRHVYGHLFRSEFNLGFHVPKKDVCSFCASFANLNEESKLLNEQNFKDHVRRKSEARKQKSTDKAQAIADKGVTTVNFDLQKVLITPKSNISDFYYSRKLSTYNFSVYNLASRSVKCFMWDETVARRGSCEIASCIYKYNTTLGSRKEVIYYSDSCTGQQRNLQFSTMCLYSVNNLPIQRITHNYFERGHSQMEGDSVHAVIEKATRHSIIYTPAEWMVAVRNSKQQSPQYDVIEVDREFVKDFKKLAETVVSNRTKADDGSKVEWMKIHSFQYRKSDPHKVFFKYEISEEKYRSFTTSRVSGRAFRDVHLKGAALSTLYRSALPVNEAKFKDLISLCDRNLIPPHCQEFYRRLPHNNTVRETLPEPDEDDVSDSEE